MATRQGIRESLVEDWLAEADSNFYTDTVLNDGINWAYRRLASAMGGVDTSVNLNTTLTAPYEYTFDRSLIHLEKATYNPNGPSGEGVKELYDVSFDDMFVYYGRQWIDDAAGTPELLVQRGFKTFYLYPRASSIITSGITLFGRGLPDDLSADTGAAGTALTPAVFDDIIGAGAVVYALRRLGMHQDTAPPMFPDALQMWVEGLKNARTFARNFPTYGLRISGNVPSVARGPWRRLLYDFELRGG